MISIDQTVTMEDRPMILPEHIRDVFAKATCLYSKSEVEAVNDQLSAAINEVKKRNQQKIDERQQLRSETNIQDSEIPINQSNQNSRDSE